MHAATAPSLLEKARKAVPIPRLPRKFFDPLVPVTQALFDRGFKLTQAAEWLIVDGALKREHRDKFFNAMAQRLYRARQLPASRLPCSWKESLSYYPRAHAVQGSAALCGAAAGFWTAAAPQTPKCTHCLGIVKRGNFTIA